MTINFKYSRHGIEGREKRLERALEILPGVLSWSIIAGIFLLSITKPLAAAVVMIAFLLYWLLRLIYLSIFLVLSYIRLEIEKKTDWMECIRAMDRLSSGETAPAQQPGQTRGLKSRIAARMHERQLFHLQKSDRPIVVNAMTYPNGLLRFFTRLIYKRNPVGETIDMAPFPALNVYHAIGQRLVGRKVCFWTNPGKRTAYLRRFVQRASSEGKPLWITELQAEPWEPGELVHSRKEDAVTCGAQDFLQTFRELRRLGIDTIFLWGCEYWVYRQQRYQDDSWMDAADKILEAAETPAGR